MTVIPPMTQEVRAKYTFSPGELKDIGDALAGKIMGKAQLADEKRSVMSDFKDRLDRMNMDIHSMSNNLILRYEFRTYRCRMVKDFNKKVLQFFEVNTDELIETRPFGPEYYQDDFLQEEVITPKARKIYKSDHESTLKAPRESNVHGRRRLSDEVRRICFG